MQAKWGVYVQYKIAYHSRAIQYTCLKEELKKIDKYFHESSHLNINFELWIMEMLSIPYKLCKYKNNAICKR